MRILKLATKEELSFDEAKIMATDEAAKHLEAPMILSWLNRKTGRHSPDVDCCQAEDKESWEIYAESRGGTTRIEIDDHYVFIFREGLKDTPLTT